MKFIKYAVGLVIALSVIPLVVVTVNNLDVPRLRTVEFEVIDIDNGTITFSENTFNDIQSLAIYDDNEVSNLITTTLNDIELVGFVMDYNADYFVYQLLTEGRSSVYWEELDNTNNAYISDYTPTIGDKWEMTFDVSTTIPPLVKLLVGFAPLLFVGGVLIFMLNKRKSD